MDSELGIRSLTDGVFSHCVVFALDGSTRIAMVWSN